MDAERRRSSLELGQPAFLVFPLHKTLTPLSCVSVSKSLSLECMAGNDSWMALPLEGAPWGIQKAPAALCSLTQELITLVLLDFHLFLHMFIPSSSVLGAPLHGRHGASPQQDTGEENHSLLSWCCRSQHWHRRSLNLTLPRCPNLLWNTANPHSLPQPLTRHLVSTYWGRAGISYRFLGRGKAFECSPLWSFLPDSCFKYSFEVQKKKYKWTHLFPCSVRDWSFSVITVFACSFRDILWLLRLSLVLWLIFPSCGVLRLPRNDLLRVRGWFSEAPPNPTETPAGSGRVFPTCLNHRQSWGGLFLVWMRSTLLFRIATCWASVVSRAGSPLLLLTYRLTWRFVHWMRGLWCYWQNCSNLAEPRGFWLFGLRTPLHLKKLLRSPQSSSLLSSIHWYLWH